MNGAGFGIASTAMGTIVASIIPPERRGEGISYYAMSNALASAIGPFLGMFIIRLGSFSIIVSLVAMLLVVSLISVFFLKVPEVELTKEQAANMKGFALKNFFEAKAIPISFIGILIGIGLSSILSFIAAYVRDINLVDAGSFFFIVYAAATLISRSFTGRLFDQKEKGKILSCTRPSCCSRWVWWSLVNRIKVGCFCRQGYWLV